MITQIGNLSAEYQELFDSILQEKVNAEKVTARELITPAVEADPENGIEAQEAVYSDPIDTYYIITDGDLVNPKHGGVIMTGVSLGTVMKTDAILDLPLYFEALDKLRSISGFNKYKYLRIPLQEQMLTIGDDRRIEIPAFFNINGVGVRGDHTAEVLYFKMHRFQDAMDLTACVNGAGGTGSGCYIQWVNANNEEMLSPAYNFDWDNEWIYFGWVISNVITSTDGNVQFGVRFIQYDTTNRLVYSYSSLTATLRVQPGLDLDTSTSINVEDAWEDVMNTRSIYSGVISSSVAAKANFTTQNRALLVNDEPAFIADLTYENGEPITQDENGNFVISGGTLDMRVAALPADGGILSYQWYHDDRMIGEATNATYTADGIGTYMAKVGNTIVTGETSWVDSANLVIPAPGQIKVTNKTNIADLPWFAYSGAEGTELQTILRVTVEENNEGDEVRYQWFKRVQVVDPETNMLVFSDPIAIPQANASSYNVPQDETGYFFCKVYNMRNNAMTTDTTLDAQGQNLASNPGCYIHEPSKKPVFQSGDAAITLSGNTLTANLTPEWEEKDFVHYKWARSDTGAIANSDSRTLTISNIDAIEDGTTFICTAWQEVFYQNAYITIQTRDEAGSRYVDSGLYKSDYARATYLLEK